MLLANFSILRVEITYSAFRKADTRTFRRRLWVCKMWGRGAIWVFGLSQLVYVSMCRSDTPQLALKTKHSASHSPVGVSSISAESVGNGRPRIVSYVDVTVFGIENAVGAHRALRGYREGGLANPAEE